MPLVGGAEGVFPAHNWLVDIAGVGYHCHQRAAIDPLPAPLQGDKVGRFAAGGQQTQALLYLQANANGDAHAPFGQETTAAPPAQGRVITDACPVEDAEAPIRKVNRAMLLRFGAGRRFVAQARPMFGQFILAHGARHLCRFSVKAKIAAHDADAVITMTGKVVEGAIDAAKEARFNQFQLDLFQRATVKLFSHLNF